MPGRLLAGLVTAVAGLSLAGCREVVTESSATYEPAKVEPAKGGAEGLVRVAFTAEGARRVGLETAVVRRDGRRLVVPHASLIYSPEGRTFVFTSPEPLTFVRAPVTVAAIDGDRAELSDGPPPGTAVVTAGAAQVYGAEQDIAGGH